MNTTFCGLLIPFLGTTFGSACVFFMKREMNDTVQRTLLGFASGVMVAAASRSALPEFTFSLIAWRALSKLSVWLVNTPVIEKLVLTSGVLICYKQKALR